MSEDIGPEALRMLSGKALWSPLALPSGRRLVYYPSGPHQPGDITHQKDRQTLAAYDAILGEDFEPKSVLEIGVAAAGSLIMWTLRFAEASVIGVDRTMSWVDEAARAECAERGIRLVELSMPNEAIRDWGEHDLVIYDGAHGADSVLASLTLCWPLVRPGGLYVIEDWHLPEFDPVRTAGSAARLVIGADDGANFCDGELPPDSAALVVVHRRAIAIYKRPSP